MRLLVVRCEGAAWLDVTLVSSDVRAMDAQWNRYQGRALCLSFGRQIGVRQIGVRLVPAGSEREIHRTRWRWKEGQ